MSFVLGIPQDLLFTFDHADQEGWRITLGDISKETAEKKINGHHRGEHPGGEIMRELAEYGIRFREEEGMPEA